MLEIFVYSLYLLKSFEFEVCCKNIENLKNWTRSGVHVENCPQASLAVYEDVGSTTHVMIKTGQWSWVATIAFMMGIYNLHIGVM